jgi:arylsulfatase A-like enzyme/lipopolysaccharide biosynthesis regulator YciM
MMPKKKRRLILILAAGGIMLSALAVRFLLLRPRGATGDIERLLAPLKGSDLNVVLFTLDTTRADRIGCYGYGPAETPQIDELARTGVRFERVVAQVPLTLPSHSSIFTGTYPQFHGVRDNGGFYLDSGRTTLAEVLQKAGWTTSAFIAAFVLDSRWGLNQGFGTYYDNFDFAKYKTISLDSVRRDGAEVIGAFRDWLDTVPSGKFFSWIHLYDPHSPWDPPEPYKSRHAGRPWGLYDGAIAYTDSLVGEVREDLKKRGLLEKTVIIVAADHGESLGEHHESFHGFFIYDATVSVPLIVNFPSSGLRGRVVASQVENVDIMPSILQLLGQAVPAEVQGRSFLPLVLGDAAVEERLAYSESYYPRYHYGWSELKSLSSAAFRYVRAPVPEVYDLVRDPGETKNIFYDRRDIAERYERALEEMEARVAGKGVDPLAPKALDEDTREKLMALGYVGGFTSAAKLNTKGPLADPKDRILLYNRIKQAESATADKKWDVAKSLLDGVITEDPGVMEARQVRARVLLELGETEAAVADCRAALAIDPEYAAAIFTLAQAFKKQKKWDEAIAGYERLLQLDPRDVKPHVNLGEIYLNRKDFDRAIAHLREAVDRDPEQAAMARNFLGAAYLEKGMLDPAERELRLSLEKRPRIPDAHYNLGLIAEARGDLAKAVEEYGKELEIHPGAYPAHFNLALVLRKTGDAARQIEHLKKAIEVDPGFAKAYLFLSKAYLDAGENFPEAIELARKGLALDPEADSAPLGHYVLADIFDRTGREQEYREELEKGRLLEQRLKERRDR